MKIIVKRKEIIEKYSLSMKENFERTSFTCSGKH
jgi:hypothetical protein